MTNHDTTLIAWGDVPAAFGLLTRLPIPVDTDQATARGARAAWVYPLVGAALGVICAATAGLALWLGLPGGIAAALVLAVSIIITGAMHEDGLADSADGLWGGWTPERRLEIMRDSHIGVYGVTAIALSLLIRWLAMVVIIATGTYWTAFIAVGAMSRLCMVLLMAGLPNARTDGLSHSVGKPPQRTLFFSVGVALVIILSSHGFGLFFPAAMAALFCGLIARTKIGGQTGDILGATQQITEIVLLLTLVAAIS